MAKQLSRQFLRLLCVCCLFIAAFTRTAVGAAQLVVLDETATIINPAKLMATFKAPENQLSLQQITSPDYSAQFRPNTVEATNYGYHAKDFWLRFDVTATSQAEWYLLIDHTVMGSAELFIIPHHSATPNYKPQEKPPLFQAVPQQRTPSWRLQLPPHQRFSVYLRMNIPKEALVIPLKLMPEDTFITHTQQRYLFFSIVWGGIVILALYNLFLAFFLKDKSYFAFVICLCFAIFVSYRGANLFPAYFDLLVNPNNPYYSSIGMVAYASCHYYMSLLHHNTYYWLEMYSKIMVWLAGAAAVFAFFFYQSADLFLFFFVPSAFIFPALMIRAIVLGHDSVRNSFLSIMLLIASFVVYLPLMPGIFPDYPATSFHLGQAGILLSFLIFSLNHAARTRQVIAQAERTEANSKATHNFLTTMNHELRTPMHVVMGASELLKTTALDRSQKNYLNSLDLASQQMLELIDEVLDTARLHNTNTISLNQSRFDLQQLLLNISSMFDVKAQEHQLDFFVDIQIAPGTIVIGDARRLSQVLVNLLGNAIKYTDTGSIGLTVSTQQQTPTQKSAQTPQQSTANTQNTMLYFSVEDTGAGIPIEQQTLIFQPFFQTDSSHSRSKDGAGLGLAICHKLVQQMGGELALDSTPGIGSRFFFTLDLPVYQDQDGNPTRQPTQPAAAPKALIPKTAPSAQALLKDLNILLVDDGELNLMIGEQLLSVQGAKVTTATNGNEALDILRQDVAFDLVLMDISMPGIDGYQTTRHIREDLQLDTLPIIALTAHAVTGEKERCRAAGINDYLSKPFKIERLNTLLQRYIIPKK